MEVFLSPKLEGQRFAGHSVPLDMLKDFAALQEMLVEVAKWRYLQENPERQRTPRNFTADFDLKLTEIRDGSAILDICLMVASLFPSGNQRYLERAKSDIVEAVAAAEAGQQPSLPPRLLSYFDRFGRGLKPGESISFEGSGSTTKLSSEVRQKLLRYSEVQEWTDEVTLYGRVYEADLRGGGFQFETLDGQRVTGPLTGPHKAVVTGALSTFGEKDGQVVSVQGVARFDTAGRLVSFESVEHVSVVDALDIDRRVAELSLLRDGWLDGDGNALNQHGLRTAGLLFRTRYDPALPPPYLYPTIEGDLRAEWSLEAAEVSLDINLSSLAGTYNALLVPAGQSTDLALDLSADEGWQHLNEALRALTPQVAGTASA